MSFLIVDKINKSYTAGDLVLKDVTFSVERGELFGVIGPDGAGKTTLFRVLSTLLLADEGDASIGGKDVVSCYREIREEIGYMPGRFSLYEDLTIAENIDLFASLFKTSIEENYHLIEDIYKQIEPFKDRLAGKLSGGMKQKLALCCALIHKPSILFLDEPTTGVDPVSRREFWEMLKRLKAQNITIVVSTPYMDEASLCDRVALIDKGEIFTIDTPERIVNSYGSTLYSVSSEVGMAKLLRTLKLVDGVQLSYAFGECAHVTLRDGFDKEYLQQQIPDITVTIKEPTIEDCFIKEMSSYGESN